MESVVGVQHATVITKPNVSEPTLKFPPIRPQVVKTRYLTIATKQRGGPISSRLTADGLQQSGSDGKIVKVKLDLHTHVWEAFNFQSPTAAMAEQVVGKIKDRGIDGIAITDHHNKEWSFQFRELVERDYPGEVIIIPGWEIEVRPAQNPFAEYQVAELFLPGGGVFRSYCHPGYYSPDIIIEDNIHAIEIDNYIHNWHIKKNQVTEAARTHDLLVLEVSDAHSVENIGLRYTELELEELYRRAIT